MDFEIPWNAFLGGGLLGLSASLLMLFSGKVAGISGIVFGIIRPQKKDTGWRIAFIFGMILSVYFVSIFGFQLPKASHVSDNYLLIMIAGLLVGFGSKLGNGCTSGHGIVGMGRFSKRSIVSTMTFMITAMAVVYIRKIVEALSHA